MFNHQFRSAYLASLTHYRHFYDDFDVYGDPERAEFAFYFVPGINGTPGQVRFALPSLIQRFGPNLYLKGCFLPEFAASRPIWEKYELRNVDKKRERIGRDLREMLGRFKGIYVIASSNGFYDFYLAARGLEKELLSRITLLWIACAPDKFGISPWVEFFHRWTGFEHGGCKWAAVPNSNWLKRMNPETSIELAWRYADQRRTYFKEDLESRFRCFGVRWAFTSPECFNRTLDSARGGEPIDVTTHVLAAANDGYWYGKPPGALDETLDRYLVKRQVLRRPASHLWVVTPDHLTAYLLPVGDRRAR